MLVERGRLRGRVELVARDVLVARLAVLDVDEDVGEFVAVDDEVFGVRVWVGGSADGVCAHAYLFGRGGRAGEINRAGNRALLSRGLVGRQVRGLGGVVAAVGRVLLVVVTARACDGEDAQAERREKRDEKSRAF